MKKPVLFFVLIAAAAPVFAAETYRERFPQWMLALRDAVYGQTLSAGEVYPLYVTAKARARQDFSGIEELNALSRCEYLMGKAYQYYKEDARALACYEAGYGDAEQSLAIQESADAWTMLSSNLSQICLLKPWHWIMAHGLDVGKFAGKAMKLNGRDGTALHLIAARWVFAPAPFNNLNRGISMMKDMMSGNYDLQKDDLFNAYIGLAYAYLRSKDNTSARFWMDKALVLYPTNKFVGEELETYMKNGLPEYWLFPKK